VVMELLPSLHYFDIFVKILCFAFVLYSRFLSLLCYLQSGGVPRLSTRWLYVGDRTDRDEKMYVSAYIFHPLSVRSPTYKYTPSIVG